MSVKIGVQGSGFSVFVLVLSIGALSVTSAALATSCYFAVIGDALMDSSNHQWVGTTYMTQGGANMYGDGDAATLC